MWFLRVWYLTSSSACAGIKARHGNTAATRRRACGSVRAGVFLKKVLKKVPDTFRRLTD